MRKVFRSFASFVVILLVSISMVQAEEKKKEEAELEEIVVTATRTEKPVEESPVAVSVITSKDIEKSAVRTVDEALKYTPGTFHWQRSGLVEPHPFIHMRGFRGSMRNLSLIDGMSLNDAAYGSIHWQGIPLSNVERIEVVRGPFSALYGGGAMGGVVNIITKTPLKREVDISASYGTYDTQIYNISYGDRLWDKVSISLGYEGRRSDGYGNNIITKEATAATGTIPVTGWERTTDPQGVKTLYIIGDRGEEHLRQDIFYGKMSFDITLKSNISFSVNHTDRYLDKRDYKTYLKDAAGNPVDTGEITFYDEGDKKMTVKPGDFLLKTGDNWRKQTIYSAKYSNEIAEGITLKVNLGLNDIDTDVISAGGDATLTGGPGELSKSPDKSYHNDIQINFPLAKRHIMTTGVSYSNLWNERTVWSLSNWTDKGSKGNVTRETEGKSNLFAIYLQDEILLHERLTLYLGGRYDYWRVSDGRVMLTTPTPQETTYSAHSDSHFSPKVSIHYKPFETTILRTSAGQSFRPPLITDLYARSFHYPDTWTFGNPDLKPETTTSWELGISQKLFNEKTLFSATYFESYVDDLISAVATKTDPATGRVIERQNQNVAKAKIKGIEAEIKQKIMKSLSAFANFTWQDAITKENPANRESEGKRLTLIPEIMYNVGIAFSKGGFDTSVITKYVSKVYSRDDNKDRAREVPWGYDSIFVTDIKVGYQFTKWAQASLEANNLFDKEYYYAYEAPGRTIFGTLTLTF
ncbi:MAG: TonB-dependent receptor [Nitrospirota bacterium]|nr:TonB-dependent receptor [Nitrospirota bacterium]